MNLRVSVQALHPSRPDVVERSVVHTRIVVGEALFLNRLPVPSDKFV